MEKLSQSSNSSQILGTLSDVWVIIALIIPGFIVIKIITWFIGHEFDFGQFLITIYSLITSLGLIVVLSILPTGVELNTMTAIRTNIVNPNIIAILFGLSIMFGVTAGVILKLTIFPSNFAGTAWYKFAKTHIGGYVKVYTKDGKGESKVYFGYIKNISTGKDDKRELTLGDPEFYSNKSKSYIKLGPELFISQDSILQIEKTETS
jgi:hypothetical protein